MRLVPQSELPLSAPLFLLGAFTAAALAGLLVWSLVDVPVFALGGANFPSRNVRISVRRHSSIPACGQGKS